MRGEECLGRWVLLLLLLLSRLQHLLGLSMLLVLHLGIVLIERLSVVEVVDWRAEDLPCVEVSKVTEERVLVPGAVSPHADAKLGLFNLLLIDHRRWVI